MPSSVSRYRLYAASNSGYSRRPTSNGYLLLDDLDGIGEVLIRQDEYGYLVAVGQLEALPGKGDRLPDRAGGEDDPGEFPVTGVEDEVEIALLGPRRQTRGRAGPLGDGDDDGRLGHARQGDPLLHQGEAAAGGGCHGPYPGVGGPQDHVDGCDLVLGLLEVDRESRGQRREVVQDGGGGGHRVPGHELAAAEDGAEGQGLIAVELAMLAGPRRHGNGPGQVPFPGKLETLLADTPLSPVRRPLPISRAIRR